ncbi:hypothetical protein WN55_00336 [Dufourea novaeangliae]|uniref:Uncharacterized protein n=1 Tax=Dufourea novaeangliae TaxID=178035 RepID=A0A154PGJ1_DUFNO|nr:hypothetical protein WN55_00336 [Dufourea novaeangliae]
MFTIRPVNSSTRRKYYFDIVWGTCSRDSVETAWRGFSHTNEAVKSYAAEAYRCGGEIRRNAPFTLSSLVLFVR